MAVKWKEWESAEKPELALCGALAAAGWVGTVCCTALEHKVVSD